MDPGAHVTSLDAIESFRASLLVYAQKAKVVLDDAADEITRTREWLRADRLPYWEAQVRHRKRKLEDAKAALFRSRTVAIRSLTPGDQAAVHTAKRVLQEAEDKLVKVKQWLNKYDPAVAIPAREIEHLRGLVVGKLPGGAAFLGRAVQKLQTYAETGLGRAPAEPPPAEPAETPNVEGGK